MRITGRDAMRKTRIRVMGPKGYNRDFPEKLRIAAVKMGITPKKMHAHKAEILEAWQERPRVARAHEVLMMSRRAITSGERAVSLLIMNDIDSYVNQEPEHEGHIGIANLVSGTKHRVVTRYSGRFTPQPHDLYMEDPNDR